MDLGLNEQQEMLKTFARDFLEKECPEQHVRDMEEDVIAARTDDAKHKVVEALDQLRQLRAVF